MINGSMKLFRLFGIDVFLHWSWFLVAAWLIPRFGGVHFTTMTWGVLLYVSLFGIVLIHEFGHALACRSVGGQAKHIVLWPLGGVAFVSPPQRPGAVLWSIVAGPLVNVLLVPVTVFVYLGVGGTPGGLLEPLPHGNDLLVYCQMLLMMNVGLLVFNMMPVYPLDGGQTLMALLWFVVGRAKALKFVSILGLVAAAAVILLSIFFSEIWFLVMALFVGVQAWNGYRMAMQLAQMDPKHYDERYAKRAAQDEVEQRISEQIDPWRR